MTVVEFCTLQGFKAAQDLMTGLANRWRGVDHACLDLTDLPLLLPCRPPTHLVSCSSSPNSPHHLPSKSNFPLSIKQAHLFIHLTVHGRLKAFSQCLIRFSSYVPESPQTESLSYICHFNTMTVHRPVISEHLMWIQQIHYRQANYNMRDGC